MGPGWWYFGLCFVGWTWPPATIFVPHFGKTLDVWDNKDHLKAKEKASCYVEHVVELRRWYGANSEIVTGTWNWVGSSAQKKVTAVGHQWVGLEMSPKYAKIFRWMSRLATFLVVDEWVGMTKPTTKPVSDLKMLKTLLTGFLSVNKGSFVDLPNSTNTLVTCCFLRCKNCETWKTSTIFFFCVSRVAA